MTTTKPQSPCAGAVQIGSTYDLRAVWQRDGANFMVIYDAAQRAHVLNVTPDEIMRRLDPPIPWRAEQLSP